MLKYFLRYSGKKILPTKSCKNQPKKLHTYGSWEVFFSAAPSAQTIPKLHFRFIDSPIQSSVLKSVDRGLAGLTPYGAPEMRDANLQKNVFRNLWRAPKKGSYKAKLPVNII